MDQQLNNEITTALQKIEQVYDHIDNAIFMSTQYSFLQDTLHVASRNLATARMKLQVANDITESIK